MLLLWFPHLCFYILNTFPFPSIIDLSCVLIVNRWRTLLLLVLIWPPQVSELLLHLCQTVICCVSLLFMLWRSKTWAVDVQYMTNASVDWYYMVIPFSSHLLQYLPLTPLPLLSSFQTADVSFQLLCSMCQHVSSCWPCFSSVLCSWDELREHHYVCTYPISLYSVNSHHLPFTAIVNTCI